MFPSAHLHLESLCTCRASCRHTSHVASKRRGMCTPKSTRRLRTPPVRVASPTRAYFFGLSKQYQPPPHHSHITYPSISDAVVCHVAHQSPTVYAPFHTIRKIRQKTNRQSGFTHKANRILILTLMGVCQTMPAFLLHCHVTYPF